MSPQRKSELHSLLHPGIAVSPHLSVGTATSVTQQPPDPSSSLHKAFPLPNRPLTRRKIDCTVSVEEIEQWARNVEVRLEPVVPTLKDKKDVLRLLYTYRDLNGEDLTDLPCTNLIVHRVKLLPETQPVSVKSQESWSTYTE